MVGALILYRERIIGEGFYQQYGGTHAEVNAWKAVKPEDQFLLSEATLFVSLEPCGVFGQTPACTDLIIKQQIPKVVFASLDSSSTVNEKSVKSLMDQGIEVVAGVLDSTAPQLNAIHQTFHTQKRPYVILKYAQSADGFIGREQENIWLTNPFSKRLVHKWRSESAAIIVGTQTALVDNPQLTNRYFPGGSPLRIVLDRQLRLPQNLHLFDDRQATWIITAVKSPPPSSWQQTQFITLPFDDQLLHRLLHHLYKAQYSSFDCGRRSPFIAKLYSS